MIDVNGIVCINKPKGMTSFDVIRQIQRKLGVKAGHSGTLDPEASGVLVVAINKATKALQFMEIKDKVYEATLKLGTKTDTGDIWGKILDTKPLTSISEAEVASVLKSMIKKQSQRVPMVSAKKVDGKKLYEYHRQNIEIETQYTDIEIFDIELLDFKADEIKFRAHVSNGTYIRTLCEDIAEKLGTLGTMSSLKRTQVGKFKLSDCIDFEALTLETPCISVKDAIMLDRITDESYATQIMHGKRIKLENVSFDIVLMDGGLYYAVYKREKDDIFRSVRGLW